MCVICTYARRCLFFNAQTSRRCVFFNIYLLLFFYCAFCFITWIKYIIFASLPCWQQTMIALTSRYQNITPAFDVKHVCLTSKNNNITTHKVIADGRNPIRLHWSSRGYTIPTHSIYRCTQWRISRHSNNNIWTIFYLYDIILNK